MSPALLVIAAIVAVVLLWTWFTFNRFIRQRNLTREAWSGVDVQLKRRHDLVPAPCGVREGLQGIRSRAAGKI